MGKIAFVYPGQGAQKPGMGKDFAENGERAAAVYELAQSVLDFPLRELCFEENEKLNETRYTQAALVATCLAITEEITALGVKPDVTAGLSLGEYAALAAAGAMKVEDAVRAVRRRGILMSEAVPAGEGGMSAVLGLSGEQTEEAIAGIDTVTVANYNCPGQVVVTGMLSGLAQAQERLLAAGAKRVLPLKVSGPFHSPYLQGAGEVLRETLSGIALMPLCCPYVSNVTAEYVTDCSETKALLVRQVSSPVRWEQSMRNMIAHGVDTFVEIGPGRTIAGFMKKIAPELTVWNVGSWDEFLRLKENWGR